MEELLLFGILIILSVSDVKTRTIPALPLFLSLGSGIVYRIVFCQAAIGEVAVCLLPAVMIAAVSIVSGGKIGMGDAIVFATCGAYIGIWKVLWLMVCSLLLASVIPVIFRIVRKRRNGEEKYRSKEVLEVPLVPYVAAATVVCFLHG